MRTPQDAPRIVIVGGVAGGASAATRARRANEHAHIVLLEKDDHVSFANCGLPYYIGGEIADRGKLLVASPEHLAQRYAIDVRARHEALSIDRRTKTLTVLDRHSQREYTLPYDKLILSPGAAPIRPDLPGLDAQHVYTLRNLDDTDAIKAAADGLYDGDRAVVVGGGYIGLEMVEQFVHRGIPVTLVEREPQVLPLLDPEMAQPIHEELVRRGVDLRLGRELRRVQVRQNRAVGVELSDGQPVEAGLIIVGVGVRPSTDLAADAGIELGASRGIAADDFGRTSDPDIYAVGDAAEYAYGPTGARMRIPLAGPANRAGRIAGQHAASGQAPAMAPVMGTSGVRVFGLDIALTGMSLGKARQAGADATAVTIIAPHHVGYYPGAKPITLKLVYERTTGRVLGAQALGEAGADKRIDVIATAMAFGATVRDLAGLDLVYAPPFGAAKDPLHMAAFAASNELDGLVKFVQPDADLSGVQVVDVRTDAEVSSKPLPGADHAVHIPIDALRDRVGELDAGRPTVTVCASGMRSYLAARILAQHGFADVADLTGGQTLRQRAFDAAAAGQPAPAAQA